MVKNFKSKFSSSKNFVTELKNESLKFYEELESKTPQEERWKLMRKVGEGDLLPGEEMMPSKITNSQLKR